MHIGMLVGAFMILAMMLPMCCCKLSDERYRKILERYEQRSKDSERSKMHAAETGKKE